MPEPRPPHDSYGRRVPSLTEAVRRRAQGRRRVANTTRWALAAAAAGATVLGAGYAHTLPGISTDSSSSTPSSTPSDSSTSNPDSSGGLQAPSQAPAPATQAPQTQSGAS